MQNNTNKVLRGELADLICHEAGIQRPIKAKVTDGIYLNRQEMVELLAFVQSLKRRFLKHKAKVGEMVPGMVVGPRVKSKKPGRLFQWH
jgi:hypothetical protein